MANQTPSCCDTEWQLLYKIVLQFQSMVTDQSLITDVMLPIPSDGPYELWRKILLTIPLI